jgi:hypothetical protein
VSCCRPVRPEPPIWSGWARRGWRRGHPVRTERIERSDTK